MALQARDCFSRFSGGGTGPTSLGGGANAAPNYELTGFLTSAMTNLRVFEDTARIGDGPDAHVGKYILFIEGPAALSAAKCLAFDDATGVFVTDQPASALGQLDDGYRIFPKNFLWQALTPAESANGSVHYRAIDIFNVTGQTLNDHQLYVKKLDSSNIGMRVAVWNDDLGTVFTAIPDQETVPDIAGDVNFSTVVQRETVEVPFVESLGLTGQLLMMPPTLGGGSFAQQNGARKPLWISRHTPPGLRAREEVAFQFLHVYSDTGGDPDPFVVSWIAFFDVGGFTPDITVNRDRQLRQNGGVRYEMRLRAQETGLPVAEVDVDFELAAGPGVLNLRPPDDRLTDAAGFSFGAYEAPAADGNVGDTVTVNVKV